MIAGAWLGLYITGRDARDPAEKEATTAQQTGNLDQVASRALDTVAETQKQLARGTGLWMGSVRRSLV